MSCHAFDPKVCLKFYGGTLNVTFGHRPNVLDLYKPRQLLTSDDDPNQSLLKAIYESDFLGPPIYTVYGTGH